LKLGEQKTEVNAGFLVSQFLSLFFVLLTIVVIIAMSSSASFSSGCVSAGGIPHYSHSNSSHIWVSSAS